MKTEIFTFLPFAILFIIFAYWIMKKHKFSKAQPYIIISALTAIDFIHPSIINSMVDSLSCVQIDNEYLLKNDYFY